MQCRGLVCFFSLVLTCLFEGNQIHAQTCNCSSPPAPTSITRAPIAVTPNVIHKVVVVKHVVPPPPKVAPPVRPCCNHYGHGYGCHCGHYGPYGPYGDYGRRPREQGVREREFGAELKSYKHGVRVMSVEPGSVASRLREIPAGYPTSLKPGDYIVSINGKAVSRYAEAYSAINSSGKTIRLVVFSVVNKKKTKPRTVEGVFSLRPGPSPTPDPASVPYRFGVYLENTSKGIEVTWVEPDSPAATKVFDAKTYDTFRLRAGDVIKSINGFSVSSAAQALSELKFSTAKITLEIVEGSTGLPRSLFSKLRY